MYKRIVIIKLNFFQPVLNVFKANDIKIVTYLVKALVVGGLNDHVDELSDCIVSVAGGLLLALMPNNSFSLIAAIDKGERTTEPGVILGSSSIDLI